MRKKILIISIILLLFGYSSMLQAGKVPANWKNWNRYPDVPRITGEQIKHMMLSGEKIIFIYAGYEIGESICGSIFIPYNKVPPFGSGSGYSNLKFPKDAWLFAYCP
jgi:hypothetical protein